ncbi:MAG: hypothetical protein RLP02_00910 [Coleofasciculus sp. C2-GNP5-27]
MKTADRIQDAAENAKPSLQSKADQAKNAAIGAADNVQDKAEKAKPSNQNNQAGKVVAEQERIIVEPDPTAVVAAKPVTAVGKNVAETEVTQVDVKPETPEIPEVDKRTSFRKNTER